MTAKQGTYGVADANEVRRKYGKGKKTKPVKKAKPKRKGR